MKLGNNLKELRNKNNFTQKEISEKLILTRPTYNAYEQNIAEPNIETLIKLADFYHTTIDEIVGRETELINLNGMEKSKANIIKKVIQMSDYQIDRTESYISGLIGD